MSDKNTGDIPQSWIKDYVDKLIKVAKELPENSAMQKACVDRAQHALDLVEAYRKR